MKVKKENLVTSLIIGLIFLLLINIDNNFIENETEIPFVDNPNNSGGYTRSYIHVDGTNPKNWSWTAGNYSWCYYENGYYIIENVTIDASSSPTGSGIIISNSKKEYFIIRNCSIYNVAGGSLSNNAGIKLESTRNGTLIENNCSNNNGRGGIFLYRYCYNNTIANNTVNKNSNLGIGIHGWSSDPSFGCKNNTIANNTAIYNKIGIEVGYYSENNTLIDNNCSFNFQPSFDNYGIRILYSPNIRLINNTINNNDDLGIFVTYSDYCNITGNTVNMNNKHGIYLSYSHYSNITKNTVIDNTAIGVYLRRSDNNVIKNNTINKNDLGIGLQQSDYNNVSGNDLKDNNFCIYETFSSGNIFEYNDCSSPTVTGPIYIDDTATGVGAHNWTWAKNQTWCSGSGTDVDPYIIENLKISAFMMESVNGIGIWNSNVSFIIQNCGIYNSDASGINLDNVNNSKIIDNNCSNLDYGVNLEYSNNIIITENTVNGNRNDGFYVLDSHFLNITGNTANDNDKGFNIDICNFSSIIDNAAYGNNQKGIYLGGCINNTISENEVYDNNEGIYLENNCYNNTISGNTANENYDGIHLEDSDYNSIIENIANDNDRAGIYLRQSNHNNITENSATNCNDGIFLEDENDYNNILENRFINNTIGIDIFYSDFNNIIDNLAYNNSYDGIEVEEGENNTIMGNILRNNTVYGIFLETNSNNNSIFQNFFLENGKHALDEGLDNKWNSTKIGNYWDNYSETHPNLAVDADDNGIGDVPYNISLSPLIQDHLPIFDDDIPSISIYLPTPNYVFGSIAPSYNVRITEKYLYEMWYSLDGGLHRYYFKDNGTIEQSAWNSAPEGNVTLTFSASDKTLSSNSSQVVIVKDYEAPTININSPTSGSAFAATAPSFDVTITDDYLASMWYTIDAGVHNYTFSTNTDINQTRWDAMDDGEITLNFYAIDDLGHIGTSGVSIIKDTIAPVIIITSPAEGDTFGSTAPLFNITIIENNIDEIWYSFDGGLTNYTIINNGTFNQAAWTALSQGEVTITFYVSDLAGHETSESVTVTKSVPSGLDPGVIIVIVVVSIVGGVAVISVIYIFMKRRSTPL